jgi:hypothetical protein
MNYFFTTTRLLADVERLDDATKPPVNAGNEIMLGEIISSNPIS